MDKILMNKAKGQSLLRRLAFPFLVVRRTRLNGAFSSESSAYLTDRAWEFGATHPQLCQIHPQFPNKTHLDLVK
jgi:hypothetical protein